MSWSVEVILLIVAICAFLVAPTALIWGWIRFARSPKHKTIFPLLSLFGFVLATCSGLLAIGSTIYAQHIHGFGFYDPLELKILRWGSILSLAGLLFALGGIWRKGPLRWFSIAGALGTLAFWIVVAEGE
jgi:hypothetical protein